MKSLLFTFLLGLSCVFNFADDFTQFSNAYYTAKYRYESLEKAGASKEMLLEAYRDIVRSTEYGPKILESRFKNLVGSHTIDPTIPGVKQAFFNLLSNSSKAKGAMRELLYAIEIYNSKNLELLSMDERLNRTWGNTDADIHFRYKNGSIGRIEVKEVLWENQKIEDFKTQIDKMYKEGVSSGKRQFLASKEKLRPEIKEYAKSRGIFCLDEISTGKKSPQKLTRFLEKYSNSHYVEREITKAKKHLAAAENKKAVLEEKQRIKQERNIAHEEKKRVNLEKNAAARKAKFNSKLLKDSISSKSLTIKKTTMLIPAEDAMVTKGGLSSKTLTAKKPSVQIPAASGMRATTKTVAKQAASTAKIATESVKIVAKGTIGLGVVAGTIEGGLENGATGAVKGAVRGGISTWAGIEAGAAAGTLIGGPVGTIVGGVVGLGTVLVVDFAGKKLFGK